MPGHVAASPQGSQTRSWSQSSQGRRHEGVAFGSPMAQTVHRVPERDSRSPRPQTSQRAPSLVQLQAGGGSFQPAGSSKVPPAVAQDIQDEAHMNNLRQSLLQHIQSVQLEISRLQRERQRAQQGLPDPAPKQADSLTAPSRPSVYSATPSSLTASSAPPRGTYPASMVAPLQARLSQSPGAQQLPLYSPQSSSRGFSRERSSSEQAAERWRQSAAPGSQRAPLLANSLQGSIVAPAASVKSGSSMTIPVISGGSLTVSSSFQGPARGTSPNRLDGPTRATSPGHGQVSSAGSSKWQTRQPGSALVEGRSVRKHDPSPSRPSLGSTRFQPHQSAAPAGPIADSLFRAAIYIQRFWRRKLARRQRRQSRPSQSPRSTETRLPRRKRFAPVYCAALRIQRAWKLHSWRRKFIDYSVQENRWLGSLEWLQKHNLLYGTELADVEDVQWWMQQRTTAPLDREVDPWGSEKLLDHLNRMWYGGQSAEELQQQQQEERRRRRAERREREALEARQRDWSREQRSEDIFSAFAAVGTYSQTTQPVQSRPPSNFGVATTLQAFPTADRSSTGRQVSTASTSGSQMSPRIDQMAGSNGVAAVPRMMNGGTPPTMHGHDGVAARHKGVVLSGAPPPSMQGYPRSYRVASHSPPQTHRTARATVPVTPTLAMSSRARSPVQGATPSSSRLSLPASSSSSLSMQPMQPRLAGGAPRHSSSMQRAMSGSPPPVALSTINPVTRSPMASRR